MVAARLGSWRGPASRRTGRCWSPAAPVLRRVLGRLHQAGSEQLGPMFAELDELKLLAEAAQVGVLDQGLSRGDVRASDAASPAGWVRQWGPSYRAGGAAALVKVAEAVAKPDNELLREAVLAARVPVRNAAVALGEMDNLLPRLTPACAETVLAGFVTLAESDGPASDPGAATGADRQVRAAGRVPAPRGPAQVRPVAVPAVRRRRDGRSTGCGWTPRAGRAGGDPGPAGRAATLHRARVGPAQQRPAARGRPDRDLPPRRRRRRRGADHGRRRRWS